MPIQGSSNNPFQLPQFGQKPVQQQNPFGNASGRAGGGSAPAGKPPLDGLGLFKSQMDSKAITPDISKPKPPQGAGQRLFAMG